MFENDRYRLEKNLEIQFRTPVLYIFAVEAYDFFEIGDLAAAADLPEARYARLDTHAHAMVEIIFFPLVQSRGTCAYKAHLTLEDIPELREFVQGCAADEIADPFGLSVLVLFLTADDTGIVVHLEHHAVLDLVLGHEGFLALLRVHVHAPELIHFELLSVLADSLLRKEDRSRGFDVDHRSDKDKDDSGEDTSDNTAGYIHAALESQLPDRYDAQAVGQHLVVADLLDFLCPHAAVVEGGDAVMHRDTHIEEVIHHIHGIGQSIRMIPEMK